MPTGIYKRNIKMLRKNIKKLQKLGKMSNTLSCLICGRFKKNNHKCPKINPMKGKKRPDLSEYNKKYKKGIPNPELSLMGLKAQAKLRVSRPQKELFNIIKKITKEKIFLEYPIKTNKGTRFADIAIPSLKLDIEYDGYLHKQNNDDKIRDKKLKNLGWDTIRFDKDKLNVLKMKILERLK